MKLKRRFLGLAISFILIVSLSGCGFKITSGSTKTSGKATVDKKTIELEGAKEVIVKINMGVGNLIIDKSTDKMMDGRFTYINPGWKPEVDYNVQTEKGAININQPSSMSNNTKLGANDYRWDLSFNKDIPINMDINMGVGEAELNFQELNIKKLSVKSGVGEATIDFSGNYNGNVDVDIEGGIGETTIYLPKNIGVRVKPDKGIGSIKVYGLKEENNEYTNDSYGKTQNNIFVDIKVGIGDLKVKSK
ncbi:hypothetical protein GOM49_00485 [Clostridium bovifaecis]|uniref:DUF2154 domain-containing protein n=1 Tax=Clostridium bovifaecis TaxID=2184719 RepID=A0A6I6ESS7_9CLOT|nr:hypothetical protein GOM49_00485 [Clostridium bovifaecis]